jgi:hypothetical protein
MPRRRTTLCALALAALVGARELRAQEATRLFVAPTARSLRPGAGLAGTTEVLLPFCEVGITNRLSVMAAATFVEGGAVGVMPKLQLYSGRRLQAAVGVAQIFGSGNSGGIGFGVVTLGSPDFGVTLGYGYGYGSHADSVGPASLVFVGIDKSLGRHFRLIGEGYFGGQGLGMPDRTLMAGFRVSGHRIWADLALVAPYYETGSGSPAPLFTFGFAF